MSKPVRIAIANDYVVVVAGVAAALAPYADRVEVVELDSRMPLATPVDVLLYDTFGQIQADSIDVDALSHGLAGRVVAFSWNVEPELVKRALETGVNGYIPKSVTAEELVDLIERVHAGEQVVPAVDESEENFGAWPGRELGLTDREAEILALITQGYSNDEIARHVYLGINTVKTHIRKAYRKIGVSRRAEAVLWGIDHGFRPDTERRMRNR
ncbi:response regulator transcription factor [Nocardioides lianchengensis]|uniref:DNA-binding response regulator, NarL/FixJ family, contains REC and HTH domains n=1 Tax=Nocardioides lianchengensis TaxID=1045774 RepID=A0A1G6UND3_9ACTN|nr:response regulator transcription factor [Nocardioides lianchengensis]NYG10986.1 DNA-binding NarL/FixJ family response regulator [Nocardioides lianchengensis]SDD42799.1 DNA-binding response regulator, NarL/FixJ family, contains REC and HTH domains [Nocardioides lianchengensis]